MSYNNSDCYMKFHSLLVFMIVLAGGGWQMVVFMIVKLNTSISLQFYYIFCLFM